MTQDVILDADTGYEASDIASRFAEIVAVHGVRPAVLTAETSLSYSQLNLAANRLAWAIGRRSEIGDRRSEITDQASGEERKGAEDEMDRDIAARSPVALLCGHNANMITAILGVLKAGRGYSALRPDEPSPRLMALLDQLQAEIIVCDEEYLPLAEMLAQGSFASLRTASHGTAMTKVLCLNRDTGDQPGSDLPAAIAPDDLAAITFTSGSTGEPKGVMRSHCGLLHRHLLDRSLRHIQDDDRIAFLFGASFGASQADIFSALLSGAALCPYDLRRRDLAPLAGWINAIRLTRLHLPVELFRQWLEMLPPDASFPTLREIAPAGRIFRRDLERFRPHLPDDCQVVTRLASGETGLVAQMTLNVHAPIAEEILPVGRLVPGIEVGFVDEAGQMVTPSPDGSVEGEIVVTSRFLAKGYWRRPDLTAAFAVVEDSDKDPGRMGQWDQGSEVAGEWRQVLRTTGDQRSGIRRRYRMGDWGRMHGDGVIEFLGRRDERVKVRGYSVELAAVTAALASLPAVRNASVLAQDLPNGSNRLVAFFVPQDEAAPLTPAFLRQALSDGPSPSLPDYMIPAVFVPLHTLPLGPNGKLDRQSLAALAPSPSARPALPYDYVAPASKIEQELAQIWAEVLSLDTVGVQDNFLDLGGNSILAARIVARVLAFGATAPGDGAGRRLPEPPLSGATLFTAPTVAAMAALIASGRDVEASQVARVLAELETLTDDEAQRLL